MAITTKRKKQAKKYSLSPIPNNHIMRDRLWRGDGNRGWGVGGASAKCENGL